ncbi:MAG: YggS family pyridoxal phosphate-dependent enzyme [Gemmataceae bacterium]
MSDSELQSVLSTRLDEVRGRIAAACRRAGRNDTEVTLVAVTKTVSNRVVAAAHALGLRDFGENRPQELWKKQAAIADARWHLIGHLQRNKIEKTVPLVKLFHSVDSERLLKATHEFGVKTGQSFPCLLEVNCSREEAKGGFEPAQIPALAGMLPTLTGVRIEGLMTMAAFHDDPELCRPSFTELRTLRDDLKTRMGLPMPFLSMGMSNDFEVAIEEGATHIRIGTTLFHGLETE